MFGVAHTDLLLALESAFWTYYILLKIVKIKQNCFVNVKIAKWSEKVYTSKCAQPVTVSHLKYGGIKFVNKILSKMLAQNYYIV